MRSQYDTIVIGGGPAGMAGAIAAANSGLSVLLVDEQKVAGGQIWRAVERNAKSKLGTTLGKDYSKGQLLTEKLRASNVELCLGAQVWQIEDGFKLYLSLEGKAQCIKARTILMATGAQERPNPFPGWTLPGVMTVGAAQIMIKNAGIIPDEPVWIAGTGPLPLLYMSQLLDLGGQIAGYLDTAPRSNFLRALPHLAGALLSPKGLIKGAGWLAKLRRAGVPFYKAVDGLEAVGEQHLEVIRFKKSNGDSVEVPAKLLLAHEGVVPNIHFSMALGCDHDWDKAQFCFVPRVDPWGATTRPGLFIAGDGGGISGGDAAVLQGEISGLGIAQHAGALTTAQAQKKAANARKSLKTLLAIRPFLDALYKPRSAVFLPPAQTVVCRCECQTAEQVRDAARRGAADPNQVKAATRAGMGPCQGRQCGYTVAALVAQAHDLPMGSVGFFNIRPPLKPITLGEVAALAATEADNG